MIKRNMYSVITPLCVLLVFFFYCCDLSGNSHSKSWYKPELIETDDDGHAEHPQIAFDNSDNAIVVWQQDDSAHINICANRYEKGSGWGTAELIETNDGGDAEAPQIDCDDSGNAIAVWHQYDGMHNNIWANRYEQGSGWGAAFLLETDDAHSATDPQIGFDGSGNAVAVWQHHDGTCWNIMARRYVDGAGWAAAVTIETENTWNAFEPQIAVNSSGDAFVVWYQFDGTRYNIWTNSYDESAGNWGTAELIETDDTGSATNPQIAFDNSGNAIAVWSQEDGSFFSIYANRYDESAGNWGSAELIESLNVGNATYPQIAFDNSGNAIAVWSQDDDSFFSIFANRYDSNTDDWSAAAVIETGNVGNAFTPQIAFDGSGNAVAVWYQVNGAPESIYANSYKADSGWSTAFLLETDDTGSAANPQIAFDNSGNAIVVWQQDKSSFFDIYASRYR